MTEHRQTARVILYMGPSVLVLQAQGEDFTHLPGGGIDPREDPLQCVMRELWEEIGYGLAYLRFLTILHHTWTTAPVEETMFLYSGILQRETGTQPPLAQESGLTAVWVPWWNVAHVNLQPRSVYPWIYSINGRQPS